MYPSPIINPIIMDLSYSVSILDIY
jgi:hypothetical protein